jgi:hypothetical protein
MRCHYREHIFICGDFLDIQVFPVYRKQGKRRKRAKPTSEVQEKLNHDNAAKKLTRLLHANFTGNDYEIHLTYEDGKIPADDDEFKKDFQNFLKRLKRYYKNLGISEIKYVWVAEKSSTGRCHHHVTFTGGGDRTVIEKLWGKGYANTKSLQFTEKGLAGLAHYISKKPVFFKRWSGSRNLTKPVERINNSKYTRKEAEELADKHGDLKLERLYPDYRIGDMKAFENQVNRGIYISARLYKYPPPWEKPRSKK